MGSAPHRPGGAPAAQRGPAIHAVKLRVGSASAGAELSCPQAFAFEVVEREVEFSKGATLELAAGAQCVWVRNMLEENLEPNEMLI